MTKYFAKLGLNSKVVKVHCVADDIATTEQAGIDYLTNLHNKYPFWVQTSKDGSIRNIATKKGMTYDESKDAFIPIQPFKSWTLNEDTGFWEAPVAEPDDGKRYNWNEETTSWDEIV